MEPLKYGIYCRKSSEEDTKQVQSIETQIRILHDVVKRQSLPVVEEYLEQKSAQLDDKRPIFDRLVADIRMGRINALLVTHIDRISRNFIEAGQIMKLMDASLLKEVRTPERAFSSTNDMLYMGIDFVFASHYSRNLSERVREGVATKLAKGEYPSYAPTGYVNVNKNIEPDPLRAQYIKRAYELYASGKYSLGVLTDILFDEGFRSVKASKKIKKSVIERILKDPVYHGIIRRKDQLYEGKYPSIVSKAIYDTVQDVFKAKNKSRRKTRDFQYRGLLTCAVCGCMYTAVQKKQQYDYYYCTNGRHVCDQHREYLPENKVVKLVFEAISGFTLPRAVAEESFNLYCEDKLKQAKGEAGRSELLQKQLANVSEKLDRLLDMSLDGRVDESTYIRKSNDLIKQKKTFEEQISKVKSGNVKKTLELVGNIKDTSCDATELWLGGDDLVRQDLIHSLLLNLGIADKKIASVQYKKPFSYLQNLSKTTDLSIWRRGRDSNP